MAAIQAGPKSLFHGPVLTKNSGSTKLTAASAATKAAPSPGTALPASRRGRSLWTASTAASSSAHSAAERDAGPTHKNTPDAATTAMSRQRIFPARSMA